MKKTWLAGLAAALVVGTTALAAGGADDPLISLSDIKNTLLPNLSSQVDSQVQRGFSRGYEAAQAQLTEKAADLRAELVGGVAGELTTSHFVYRVYHRGDRLTLTAGSGLVLLNGAAAAQGECIDLTLGYSAEEITLSPRHRYLAGEEVEVTILSDAANLTQTGIVDGKLGNKDATPFTDLVSTEWYYPYASYAYNKGLLKGVTEDTFAPYGSVTRAMLTTVLYRQAGQPAYVPGTEKFQDVATGIWYEHPVGWASVLDVVNGMGEGLFLPDENVTREQVAVMLCRYVEKALGQEVSGTGNLNRFPDRDKASDWAQEGLSWAVGTGILTGREDGSLDPQGTATRAEIAAMMQRLEKL